VGVDAVDGRGRRGIGQGRPAPPGGVKPRARPVSSVPLGNHAGPLDLDVVALGVIEGESDDVVAVARGQAQAYRGVQAARQDDDGYRRTSTMLSAVSQSRMQATARSAASSRFQTSWAMSSAVGFSKKSLR